MSETRNTMTRQFRQPRWLSISTIICLFVLLAGCSTQPKRVQPPPVNFQGKTLVVLPATTLLNQLSELTGDIQLEVIRQLSANGFNSFELGADTYKKYDKQALEESGSIYDPKIKRFIPLNEREYTRQLIKLMVRDGDFDVLVQPELVLRNARVRGEVASWDGQTEQLDTEGEGEVAGVRALSIKLTFFRTDGARLLQSFGGVTVPFRVLYGRRLNEFPLKPEVLDSLSVMQQAITLALEPLLLGQEQ